MPVGAIAGAAAPIVGAGIGKLIGGGGAKNAQSATPKDLQPMRQSNIGLLNYLLGFNDPNAPWASPMGQMPQMQPMGPVGGGGRPGSQAYGQGPGGWSNGWGSMPGSTQGGRTSAQPYGPTGIGSGSQGLHPSFSQGQSFGGMSPQPMNLGGGMMGMPNVGAGMPGTPMGQSHGMPGNTMSQFGGMGGGYGMQPGGGFSSQLPMTPASNPMLGRMESYFGPLGTPTTALQQQSLGGISQFLNSNPYGQSNNALSQIMGSGGKDFFGAASGAFNDVKNANYFGKASNQADKVAGANYFGGAQNAFNQVKGANYFGNAQKGFDELAHGNYYGDANNAFKQLQNYNPFVPAQGALEKMFAQNPGEGVMNALHPNYERAMAEANQTGGRFGSANAILRSRALDDYSLQMQQAMQEGVNQQINAAGQYGQMGNSLIGAKTAAGQGLLGVGTGRANQQANAAQGYLGIGQGQLQQGLGAANGLLGVGQGQLQQGLGAGQLMLGVGQGQLSQGLGAAQGLLGVGQGRSSYDLGNTANRMQAAGMLANNQNSMFNNYQGAYQTGSQQAGQEAQRQQQALQILSGLLGTSQSATLGGQTMVSPTGAQQGAQMGAGLAPWIAQMMGGGGGGGGAPMPFNNPGAPPPSFGIPYRL